MKKSLVLPTALFVVFALVSSNIACSQNNLSPRDSLTGKVGKANIEINYGSPSVRGREIWGSLVPYGQVWRVGANGATTFKTDAAIKVEGQTLPAGKYGLFAIPTDKEWTIIFNRVPDQWGAFNYDSKQDALRVKVKPRKSASLSERLVYSIPKEGMVLRWENLEIPVRISN